jgi:DNA recombination protein RmuC
VTDLLVILSFVLISVLLVWILVLINRLNRDKEASDALKQDMQRLLIQQENSDKALRDEFHKLRTELMAMTAGNREEIRLTLESLSESLSRRMNDLNSGMQDQMQRIRDNNEKKLEEMRHTVDEKLQQTLESRLGESFRQVSERLEQVHKGLGEMKVLATDVGDLKKCEHSRCNGRTSARKNHLPIA